MAREINLPLPSADSLSDVFFTTQEQRDDEKLEKVVHIRLTEIDEFPNHPFLVKFDETMQNMAESVKTFGIQTNKQANHILSSGTIIYRTSLCLIMTGIQLASTVVCV